MDNLQSILENRSLTSSRTGRTILGSSKGISSVKFSETVNRRIGSAKSQEDFALSINETDSVSQSVNSKINTRSSLTKEQLEYLKSKNNGLLGSADQPINWEADGSSSLTKEQAEYLKSKYNFSNMSQQDYDNFMSELTHMNVISAQDAVSQYVKPIPPGVVVTSGISSSSVRGAFGGMKGFGNIEENLSEYASDLASVLKWLVNNQSQMDSTQFFFLKDYWENESARCEKLKSIFDQIV